MEGHDGGGILHEEMNFIRSSEPVVDDAEESLRDGPRMKPWCGPQQPAAS